MSVGICSIALNTLHLPAHVRSDQKMDQPKHFRTNVLNFESNVELVRLFVSWFNHFNNCSIGQNNYQTFKNN
jgi:hypothetical protein